MPMVAVAAMIAVSAAKDVTASVMMPSRASMAIVTAMVAAMIADRMAAVENVAAVAWVLPAIG